MDKIHAMQLFIRVAELESFSRAADTLGLPKGSVSRQIQALESHLGVRLLHRTTRRVQLTQDGMVYYERARDLLSNLEELDGMFQLDPSSISGRLRVDMPVAVAKKLVIPQLPAFLQQYPGIELELSSSDRLVDVVREGFDCVVRVGTLKDSGLIARTAGQANANQLRQPAVPDALRLSAIAGRSRRSCADPLRKQPRGAPAGLRSGQRGRRPLDQNRRRLDGEQHRDLSGVVPGGAGHYSGAAGGGSGMAAHRRADRNSAPLPRRAAAGVAHLSAPA